MNMKDTWYDMGFDADMSWMYDWKGKKNKRKMDKSNILVNYRYANNNMTDQEKYNIDLQIQLEISKIMHKLVDEKKISIFQTGDNDYVEDILNEEYKKILL